MRLHLPLLLVLSTGLLQARHAFAQSTTTPTRVAVPARIEPDDIPPKELKAVARRVSSLCVEPSGVELHVGDTLDLANMFVVAYDSIGGRLGRLPVFDSQLPKNAHVVPTGIRLYVAMSEGRAELSVRYPRVAWLGRQDAPVEVRFYIHVVRE